MTCRIRIMYAFVAYACTTFVLALQITAAEERNLNWPQWRGPFGTGSAAAANPPIHSKYLCLTCGSSRSNLCFGQKWEDGCSQSQR